MQGYLHLSPDTWPKNVDQYIYIDIDNQHPDSMRFVKDCEKFLDKPVQILKSPYRSVERVIRQFRYINTPYGARCTSILKKRVRKQWEDAHKGYDITYIWGFDIDERNRAERLNGSAPQFCHEYPLIEKNLTKQDAHAMLERLGIKRPAMYDMGYGNNNCVGCVKGGMGYWNKIRVDFPKVFKHMAELEREIGHSCINGLFLDELEPDRGRMAGEIMPECSVMCYIATAEDE